MDRGGPYSRSTDKRSWEESPRAWLAIMVAVMAFLSLAVAAAVSFDVGHLLPNNEPFIPSYAT
jgi:hypothetical protein